MKKEKVEKMEDTKQVEEVIQEEVIQEEVKKEEVKVESILEQRLHVSLKQIQEAFAKNVKEIEQLNNEIAEKNKAMLELQKKQLRFEGAFSVVSQLLQKKN